MGFLSSVVVFKNFIIFCKIFYVKRQFIHIIQFIHIPQESFLVTFLLAIRKMKGKEASYLD